jgi:hypothetical protein
MFTDNFWKGMQLGTHWQDKAEERETKRQTLRYQLAKMQQDADFKRATLAETARRNTAYVTQSGAYADYLRKKGGALGAKGGAGGPDANVNAFLLDPRVNEPGLATPPPAPAAGGSSDSMPTPPQQPPSDDGGSGSSDDSDGMRRGGPVRMAQGGAVPNMSSRLQYQVRREEKGARLAPPMGLRQSKPLRAPSTDIIPGMKRGGPVAALNTSRTPMQPSAGTTGPGSGYGDVAAPPVTSRYANGGSVDDPTENLLNSFYKTNQDQIARNTAQASMPMRNMGDAGGSANAATGSGGDAAGGASGTGGVGGSATDGAGGSAAAGVGGDDGGTYRRGGGVRYADGGAVGFGNAFTNAAMRGSRQATAPRNPYNRYDTPAGYADGGEVDHPRPDDKPLSRGELLARGARRNYPYSPHYVPSDGPGWSDPVAALGDSNNPDVGGWDANPRDRPAPSAPPSAPPSYEPGDTGTLPRDQPVGDEHYADAGGMPPVTVTAKRDRPAGPARRRQLGDQSRTAAYDPEADRMDPRNTNITEPGGAVNERVWRATPEAHPDAYPDDNKGMFGERLDRPGPNPVPASAGTGSAINLGAPTTPTAPAQDNYAAKGASRFATNMFKGDDEHALFAGKGAPPPTEVQGVFKTIDPDDKMPLHEKMVASTKAVHDYWMAKGDPKRADQAAFEITQFGNTMARQHGAKALKAMQGGDQHGALNELLAGYGWLPDGGTPEVKDNALVIRDQNGTVTTTIPLQPGTLQNLALGMSTGQLGWDVMHSSAGRQVATSRPSAQPQAAPAGPQPTPAASPAPSAPPPTQGPPPPPTQAPAPPPTQAPVPQMGPEGGPQAISTTPPTASAAPPPAPQATPTARPAAPAPATTGTSPPGQGQRVPAQGDQPDQRQQPKTPEQEKAEAADAEQKHYASNPYAPRRVANSAEEIRNAAYAKAQHEYKIWYQGTVQAANDHGLAGKGKLPAAVMQALAAKKKKFDDDIKVADSDYRVAAAERAKANAPRKVALGDEDTIRQKFTVQNGVLTKAAKDQPTGILGKLHEDSPLRYATPDDTETMQAIHGIAANIWRNNQGMSAEEAYNRALDATSIMRPTADEKDPVGQNRQKGEKATRFRAENRGDKGMVHLRFGDNNSVQVDKETYQQIQNQHRMNYAQFKYSQTKEGQDAERRRKNALGWKTLGAGIRTVAPFVPGGAGADLLIGGANQLLK